MAAGPSHLQAAVWGGGRDEDSHYQPRYKTKQKRENVLSCEKTPYIREAGIKDPFEMVSEPPKLPLETKSQRLQNTHLAAPFTLHK